jgi:cytochrome c peroxidase
MVFKVPSLRNVEKTGPYFHHGKVATLEEAIRLMGEHQLNTQLSRQQVQGIAAWLKALTGEIPREYIRPPKLPE